MLEFGVTLKGLAIAMAAGWVAWIGLRRDFSRLNIVWAIFCIGLVAVMVIEIAGRPALGAAYPALAIASCASCSFFWLTSRELFRHRAVLGPPEIAILAGIFLPTVFDQFALVTGLGNLMGEATLTSWMTRLDGLQTLFSSAALVLAFGEGLNGWSGISEAEKRIRYVFLSAFGAGVGICVLLFDHGRLEFLSPEITTAIQGLCAIAIMGCTSIALFHRQKHPLPAGSARKAPPATADEHALARRAQAVVTEGAYLDPDLKVSTLAGMLGEKDYKVSRAIVAGLGQPNFNRFINRFRIEHAQSLLRDPVMASRGILNVALDSGFASLGPFNRAFKEATGLTPRQYREQQKAATGSGDGLDARQVFAE
ncbi:helix-turn-helix domain-containing protein [Hyphobacterium sp.]|uniref:helix-turn-helix domain-containing protein n=1 Tax=Hyphobacterium sp. TaxID=2004662 RepID=UPI003B519E22